MLNQTTASVLPAAHPDITPGLRAYGYIRLSQDELKDVPKEQRETYIKTSLDHQKKEIEDFSRDNGLVLLKIFEDQITGSIPLEERDGERGGARMVKELYDEAGDKRVDIVLCREQDRIMRGTYLILGLLKKMRETGIKLYSIYGREFIKENLKTKIKAVVDEEDIIKAKRKALVKVRTNVGDGLIFYRPPFGYKSKGKKQAFAQIPEEAIQVKKVFELFLKGEISPSTIAKNVFGDKVMRSYVWKILRRPWFYAGFVYTRDFDIDEDTGIKERHDGKEYRLLSKRGIHEPIINDELAQKIEEKLSKMQERKKEKK